MSIHSTKLAERLAALASIDLGRINAAGAVKARDVAALLPMPQNVVAFAGPILAASGHASQTLPATRNERLAHAKRETPHFYQTIDVTLDRLLHFAEGVGEHKSSLQAIVVLAVARLLQRTPGLNAAWQDEGMLLYDRVDVALGQGDRTALIADAARKGLRGIAEAIAAGEDGIGTFAIVDFAATGVREASAIVDPHHAGVIALGAVQERVASKDGAFVAESYCRLTLSADHRVIDGAAAARFNAYLGQILADFRRVLL